MKKNSIRSAALAGLIGASSLCGVAEAAPVTVNFSFLNGSTTVINGSLTYAAPSGTISAFSGFSAFNITFHNGAFTDSYVLSQLVGIPTTPLPSQQFVDFDTTTNQFVFAPSPGGAPFYGLGLALGADSGPIDFYIFNQNGLQFTDNSLSNGPGVPPGVYHSPITSAIYQVLVPEPASVALFGAGMLGLGLAVRRRRKSSKA